MTRPTMRPLGWVLFGCVALCGCDFVMKAQGVMKAAQEVGKHLETDLKAPLTEEKIERVLKILPELKTFSEEAKERWKPEPGGDVRNLAQAMGSLTEYLAFFESHETRLTEFYVDFIKITDAHAQVQWKRSRAEAIAKLEAERAQVEAKQPADDAGREAQERELKRIALAIQKLEQSELKRTSHPSSANPQAKPPYTLSDEEIARVEARSDRVREAFQAGGYTVDEAGIRKE